MVGVDGPDPGGGYASVGVAVTQEVNKIKLIIKPMNVFVFIFLPIMFLSSYRTPIIPKLFQFGCIMCNFINADPSAFFAAGWFNGYTKCLQHNERLIKSQYGYHECK